MPTYRNDGSVTYRIEDVDDIVRSVKPLERVETYDPNVPSDFTETLATPTLEKTISGENVWTGSVKPNGKLNVSVSGQFTGTVVLQRSWDDFTTPKDYSTYTESSEAIVDDDDPNVKYRIGVGSGNWTTGTVVVRLSR